MDSSTPPLAPAAYIHAKVEDALVLASYVDSSGEVFASSRTTPCAYQAPTIGSWRVSNFKGIHGHEIAQLRLMPVSVIQLTEEDWTDTRNFNFGGKRDDAMRYAEWLKSGLNSPPVFVMETDQGSLRLAGDGHRRLAAHKFAKRDFILAWVSPCMDHPEGARANGDGPILRVGLTYEGFHGIPFDWSVSTIKSDRKEAPLLPDSKPSTKGVLR
jgi:hypothetical protein